jgi:GGDEF domain-containing protein
MSPEFQKRSALKFVGRIIPCARHSGISRKEEVWISNSPSLGQEVYMTVSIGLSQYKPKEEVKAFVHRIDQLIYQAKNNGRDRIYSDIMPETVQR